MRLLHLYLVVYLLLVASAAVVLSRAGIFARVDTMWLLLSAVVVVGLGLLLAVTSTHPPVRR
jgi:hypothetical protein